MDKRNRPLLSKNALYGVGFGEGKREICLFDWFLNVLVNN